MYPSCLTMLDMTKIKINEESAMKSSLQTSKGNFMAIIGTKEGKVLVYRIGTVSHPKLLQTKGGMSFGAVTSIDVTANASDVVIGTESGEMIQYELLKKLNEE